MDALYTGPFLWMQAPLVLAVLLAAWSPADGGRAFSGRRSLRPLSGALLVAVVTGAAALWLDPRGYHFSGHEGTYGELLAGALPADTEDLLSHRVMPVPAGLAWALGWLPGAQEVWLAGNRLALGVVALLALAAGRRGLLVLAVPALWGWSATGFAVAPALALGLGAALAGRAGRPGVAMALGGLAAGTRLETLPLLLGGLLAGGVKPLRARGIWIGAAVLVLQLTLVLGRPSPVPVDAALPAWYVVRLNLQSLGLASPVLAPAVPLLLAVALAGDRRAALPWLAAAGLALLAPLGLLDLGARHFLPAQLLLVLAFAAAGGPRASLPPRRRRLAGALPLLTGLLCGAVAAPQLLELRQRYMTGPDAAPAVPDVEVDLEGCFVLAPAALGFADSPTDEVYAAHDAAAALHEGRCVRWLVRDGAEFSGDTRAERLDRARVALDLRPLGRWCGDGCWSVLGAGARPGHGPGPLGGRSLDTGDPVR